MNKIIEFLHQNGGYATSKRLKELSYQVRDISALVAEGSLVKIKPGLYRPYGLTTKSSLGIQTIDVCKAIPNAVICLVSALEYFDLTTFNPSQIHIAIPNHQKLNKLFYPFVKTYYFTRSYYESGIESVKTEYGEINIYAKEKTICDMFRYRRKLGDDLALEALKAYLGRRGVRIKKLHDYAERCGVKSIIHPYIKAMLE